MLYAISQALLSPLDKPYKLHWLNSLLLLLILSFLPGSSYAQDSAVGYRFVRFVADDVFSGSQVREVTFLNGDLTYPRLPMESNAGSIEAKFYGSAPYNGYLLFDQSLSNLLYIGDGSDGQVEYTLEFIARPIYLTGVRIRRPSWSPLTSFRVEATNDPEAGWEILYTSPPNMDNSYFGPSGTDGIFLFGTEAVAIDTVPPAAPVVSLGSVTQNSVTVEWSQAVDDASDIAGYQIYVDSVAAGFTPTPSFTQIDLQPSTDYEVTVVAYDSEFNASPPATLTVTTENPPVAEGYTYLRFTVLNAIGDRRQLVNIDWMMGEKALPFDALTTANGSAAVEISSTTENINNFDGPWKAFDDADDTHWYVGPDMEVTLRFNDVVVYPTGIAIGTYTWQTIPGFRCEASDDGVNWTLLEEREGLTRSDYQKEGALGVARFDFDLALPEDFDRTPPTVPQNITITGSDATTADVQWSPSVDAGVGVASYRLYVNDYLWKVTSDTSARLFGFSPLSAYDLRVEAVDRLGNTSDQSDSTAISTDERAAASGTMDIGSGLGSYTTGIWKENVDFAAAWADYGNANPFDSLYLAELGSYKVLRFMGMVTTNNNAITDWADRRQPDDASQAVRPNFDKEKDIIAEGMAIEWMIKLCNLTGADLWMNVPHAATDDYVTQLAALIHQYLDPELRVYIEYSNEVWGGFAAEEYANERGFALGLDSGDFPRYAWFGDDEYARFRYYVHRSVQIYGIFQTEYAGDSARVQKVLAGWSGQPDLTRVHLDALADPEINVSGIYPDYYAIAPYFGINNGLTSEEPIDDLRDMVASTMENVKAHYAIIGASGHDIGLATYEGGQHFTSRGETINRDPTMYQIYLEYLDQLAPYVDIYTNFYYAGGFSRGMAWGAKEYIGQPDIIAYKYRALEDWIDINGDNPPNLAPTILEQPETIEVAEGSGAEIFPTVVGRQPITYAWYREGELLEGETSAVLTLDQLNLDDTGTEFAFTATNAYGSAESQTIYLLVNEVPKALVAGTGRPISVDGAVDPAWEQAQVYDLDKVSTGIVTGATDLSASYRTMWDETYLYLLVEVVDDVLVPVANPGQPWNFDGVEVYLDVTNDKTEAYNANDRQVIYGYGTPAPIGVSGTLALPNSLGAQVDTEGGYRAEIAFAWTDLGVTPREGRYLGLDVAVADNDTPGGDREGKLGWWSNTDLNYTRPANFGTALLTNVAATEITISAAGRQNTETMELQIGGVTVATWANVGGNAAAGVFEAYSFTAEGYVEASDIRVAFVNDRGGARDLRVDGMYVNDERYESEAGTTLSTGTFQAGTRCNPGFKRSEWLNCNGYFAYDQPKPENTEMPDLLHQPVGADKARPTAPLLVAQPNPATGLVRLKFPAESTAGTLQILDALGREWKMVSIAAGSSEYFMDRPAGLPAGVYFLLLQRGDERLTQRVVFR
ncbi:sugar-binding protein [Lewinella sp. IMCC34191]|uniref:sugar-binding protein n=1 Tax=Lewinella sp. IMCC34191 TaxID=2259172 RepID=UPI000E269A70|nr:sugar-binding protein [Lewinella sp. IMCC34191]